MPKGTLAFGAGNIPSLAAIEGSNFRHGDIEDTLATLAMASGSFLSKLKGGKKFNNLAIKRVYFGNWLRDYSQAIDVGTLSRNINPELIRVILWIMAFTEFGYGTEEFEVTSEKLGVYRAEEHIDNPKGYAEGEDARKYDKRLRGPVDPRELEIDMRTGMKNYICNESGNWPTSSEYVRNSLKKCIEKGRLARHGGNDLDQYEAFRLLGQSLHTLEDFSAHSNYCELVLIAMGYKDVFAHVGRNCTINLNGSRVYPIVTGTFGGQDFIHSLMGGAQDSLSQVEVAGVQDQLNDSARNTDARDRVQSLLNTIPLDFTSGGESNQTSRGFGDNNSGFSSIEDEMNSLQNRASVPTTDPQEIIDKIYPLFQFRDRIMKKIESFIDAIPLLSAIKEKISDALTIYIMGVVQPILTPLITDLVTGLHSGTEMVVNDDEQFRVWTDPGYDNPTHSQLSKDHFASYLNEPAGKVATQVVAHVVPLVVKAWEDPQINVDEVINEALQVFHHPSMAKTPLQLKMKETVETWIKGVNNRDNILAGLTSDGVRNGMNLKTGNKAHGTHATKNTGHSHHEGCGHDTSFKIPSSNASGDTEVIDQFHKMNLNSAISSAAGGSTTAYHQGSNQQSSYNQHSQTQSPYNQSSHGRIGQSQSHYSQGSSYESQDKFSQQHNRRKSSDSDKFKKEKTKHKPKYKKDDSSDDEKKTKSKYKKDDSSDDESYKRPSKSSYAQSSYEGKSDYQGHNSGSNFSQSQSRFDGRPSHENNSGSQYNSVSHGGQQGGHHGVDNNRVNSSYSNIQQSFGGSRFDDNQDRFNAPPPPGPPPGFKAQSDNYGSQNSYAGNQGGANQGYYGNDQSNQGGFNQGNQGSFNQGYEQGGNIQNRFDQGDYDQNRFNQGGYNQGGYNQGGYNQGGYNQGGYNQGGYNQGGYNQGQGRW